jgi:hypothetical protein
MPTAKANSRRYEQMDGFRQSGSPRDQTKTAAGVTVRYDTGVSMHLIDPMVDSFPSRSAPSAGHILFWHRLDKSHLASREKQQALLKPSPSRHVRSRHETVRQSRPCDGIMEPPDKLQDSTTTEVLFVTNSRPSPQAATPHTSPRKANLLSPSGPMICNSSPSPLNTCTSFRS